MLTELCSNICLYCVYVPDHVRTLSHAGITSNNFHYQNQWENSDVLETKQITNHAKDLDKRCLKMYFSLNLSNCVDVISYGDVSEIWADFTMIAHQI